MANHQHLTFQKFNQLPVDIRTKIIVQGLRSDTERLLGDLYLVCKQWKRSMQSLYFSRLYNHMDHCLSSKRIRLILQTTGASRQDACLWDLSSVSGHDPKLEKKGVLPRGRFLIGTSGAFVCVVNFYITDQILLRDWLTGDLDYIGTSEGVSVCFIYDVASVLRVFKVQNDLFYEILKDGSWSGTKMLEVADVNAKGCSGDGYFCLLCNDSRFLLRIDQRSHQHYLDAIPSYLPGRKCSHHVLERRGSIHICRVSHHGLDTYCWVTNDREWVYLSHYPLIVGGDPSCNWRVFGAGDDYVLISFTNYIHVVDVVTKQRIFGMGLPVSSTSEVTAGYVHGCRCSWVKHFAEKRSLLRIAPD